MPPVSNRIGAESWAAPAAQTPRLGGCRPPHPPQMRGLWEGGSPLTLGGLKGGSSSKIQLRSRFRPGALVATLSMLSKFNKIGLMFSMLRNNASGP